VRIAISYSLEHEPDGGFSVLPFDLFGRPIPSHPLTTARFADPYAAYDAIAAVDALDACDAASTSFAAE
jgi:hypothetical protein